MPPTVYKSQSLVFLFFFFKESRSSWGWGRGQIPFTVQDRIKVHHLEKIQHNVFYVFSKIAGKFLYKMTTCIHDWPAAYLRNGCFTEQKYFPFFKSTSSTAFRLVDAYLVSVVASLHRISHRISHLHACGFCFVFCLAPNSSLGDLKSAAEK